MRLTLKPFDLARRLISTLVMCLLLTVCVKTTSGGPSDSGAVPQAGEIQPVEAKPVQTPIATTAGQNSQQLAAELLRLIDQSEAALREIKIESPVSRKEPAASVHQQQSIELLTKLIERLEQQSANSDSSGGSPENSPSRSNPDASSKSDQSKSRGQSSERESSPREDGATAKDRASKDHPTRQGNSQGQGDNQNANEAEAGNRERQRLAQEAARKRQLEVDVWGHLPDTVRGELLNSFDERILPSYERLVKKYYEALAEAQPSARDSKAPLSSSSGGGQSAPKE